MTEPDWVDPEEWQSSGGRVSTPIDAPEADAAEQSRPYRPDEERPEPRVSPDANEADAFEQSLVVPVDDDYDR